MVIFYIGIVGIVNKRKRPRNKDKKRTTYVFSRLCKV